MAKSQNGWSAGDTSVLDRGFAVQGVTFPGGVRRGDVSTVLGYVAAQFHARVEPLVAGWCWGYNYRPVTGGGSLSNHASGTAIDVNAPRHPYGKRDTFTPAQRGVIRQILAEVGGVVRWGGDYTGNRDDMHFEINAGAVAVAAVAVRLRAQPTSQNKILMTEDEMPNLPAAPSGGYAVLAVPPDANVKLIFASAAVIKGGNIYNWTPTPGQGTGGNPGRWQTEVQEGEAIALPRGTSKAHIEYTCAEPVSVFVQAVI